MPFADPLLPPVLLLPGWQDSGPAHWQTRRQAAHGDRRVVQDDWWWPRRGDWMARLDEVLLADDRLAHTPALLAAHSLGCHLVAAWAAHSRHAARVATARPRLRRQSTPWQPRNPRAWGSAWRRCSAPR